MASEGPAPHCQDSDLVGLGDVDVVRKIQDRAHQALVPLNVSMELTLRCNIRCLHCYNFDRDEPRRSACGEESRPELSLEEVLRVMGELREAGCLFLSLTGGEILSYPHLFPVLDRARELSLAVQLLSNGTLLRPGVAAKLAGYRNLLGVSISVYGATPEVHDGITQVKGSWRRTWDGAERLRALGIAVRIKLIVMRANAHEMAAMRALAERHDFPYLVDVNITSRHDGTTGSLAMRVDDAQLEELYRGPLGDMVATNPQAIGESGFRCNCARGNCAISAHGDVYPCISVPWAAGNVRERPFLDIWRSSPVFERIRGLKLTDDAACLPCPDKPFCSRSRSAAFNASGNYTGIDPFVCKTAALTRRIAAERAG